DRLPFVETAEPLHARLFQHRIEEWIGGEPFRPGRYAPRTCIVAQVTDALLIRILQGVCESWRAEDQPCGQRGPLKHGQHARQQAVARPTSSKFEHSAPSFGWNGSTAAAARLPAPTHAYVRNPARIRLRTFKSRAARLVRETGTSTHASAAKAKNGSPRSMKLPDVEAAMS